MGKEWVAFGFIKNMQSQFMGKGFLHVKWVGSYPAGRIQIQWIDLYVPDLAIWLISAAVLCKLIFLLKKRNTGKSILKNKIIIGAWLQKMIILRTSPC